MLIETDSTIQ